MINKIRDLINKFSKKNKNSEDLDSEDFTSDIPLKEFQEQEDLTQNEIDLNNSKYTFKERLHDLKTKVGYKFSRLTHRRKKTIEIPTPQSATEEKVKKSKVKMASFKGFDIKRVEAFFLKSKNQNTLHKFYQLSFIFLLVFTVGKLSALFLKGDTNPNALKGASLAKVDEKRNLLAQQIDIIRNKNIFNTGASAVTEAPKDNKPQVRNDLACIEAKRKSNLPIKLINTIVLQDSVKSIASVQVRSESLFRELRVGEKINNMAKIGKIERLKLIVKNLKTGTCESIESSKRDEDNFAALKVMSPSQSKAFKKKLKPIDGVKNDGNKFTIKRSFLKSKMKNIGDLLTQAVGTQINNSDGTISFKITNIVPGSIFSHLGITDNDTITGIGGEKITDLNAVMGTFGKLTTLDQTSITIKRGGSEVTQEYKFK